MDSVNAYALSQVGYATTPRNSEAGLETANVVRSVITLPDNALRRTRDRGLYWVLGLSSSLGVTANRKDVELQVGVVQRFGSKATDVLTLQATTGDRLSFRFETGGKEQTVTGTSATLDVVQQTLAEPSLQERVVLSTHRSFESAEASANAWLAQGILVEVAQPEHWQVWGKARHLQHSLAAPPVAAKLAGAGVCKQHTLTQKYYRSSLVCRWW